MLEKLIIEKCATTLASLKTGEIVNYQFSCRRSADIEIKALNEKLEAKGVRIKKLSESQRRFLLYVYRENRLNCDLSCQAAREILGKQGYRTWDLEDMIEKLRGRISEERNSFPHEIGLFLGYPVEDVKGFIENDGKNCCCCGYWKVYGEEARATAAFAKFDKCRRVYAMMCNQGANICRLTVANKGQKNRAVG